MNLFGKLPIVGRGSYEPNFKVEFKDGQEGLDAIVDLALRGRAGEYLVGEVETTSPMGGIRVVMQVGADGHYSLTAHLEKEQYGKGIGVDAKLLEAAAFGIVVGDKKTTVGDYLRGVRPVHGITWLVSPRLPNRQTRMEFSDIPRNAAELRFVQNPDGLTVKDVSSSISTFAQALEAVVNGAYRAANQNPPRQALYLAAGEEVKRIRVEKPQQSFAPHTLPREVQGTKKVKPEAAQYDLGEMVTLDDIGGLKKSTHDTINLLILTCTNPELLASYGAKPLRGLLLYGPPGTGKTSVGKAIANRSGLNFYYLNPVEIISKWHGESEQNLAAYLEKIKKQGRGVLFIDEIDSIAQRREGAHEATARLVSVLNQYLDGFKSMGDVIVFGATNLREGVDKATLSRFNYELEMPLPDERGREEIIGIHLRKAGKRAGRTLFGNVDVAQIAKVTRDYSGRDLATLVDRTCLSRLEAERLRNEPIRQIITQDFLAEKARYDAEKNRSGKGHLGFHGSAGG